MKKRIGSAIAPALALAVVGVLGMGAEGATWNGGGANNNWSTVLNWVGSAPPANNGTDNTHFGGTTKLAPNVDTTWNIASLTFDAGAGAFVIGGSALTIQGGSAITNNSANLETVNDALVFGSGLPIINAASGNIALGGTMSVPVTGTLTVTGSFNTTLGGAISGSFANLVKNGTGTLTFTAVGSTYSGYVQVNNGTLDLNTSGYAMSGATGLFIGDGIGTAGTAVVTEEQTNELTGSLNMPVSINTDGLLNIKTFQEYAGTVNLTGGAISTTGVGTLNLAAVSSLVSNASSQTATVAGNLNLSGGTHNFTVTGGSTASGIDLDVSAVISNGGVNKNGAGVLRLSGASTFAGGFFLVQGTTLIGVDSVTSGGTIVSGALGTGTLTFNSGNIGADGATRTVANPINMLVDATIVGTQALNFTGLATVTNGDRIITVSAGATANFNGGLAQDTPGRTLSVVGGGTFGLAGTSSFSGNVSVYGGGSLVMNSGSISPTVTDIESSGTLTLSGTGAYSGTYNMEVGGSGTGTVVQTGGVMSVNAALYLGYAALSQGNYSLSATTGAGTLLAGAEYVGYTGFSVFTQTGGTNTIAAASQLYVGYLTSSTGNYKLNGGTLNSPNEYVGYGSTGANSAQITQKGGINNVTSLLSIATNAGTVGSYTMDTTLGASQLNFNSMRLGEGGNGTFTQNGGAVSGNLSVFVGYNYGSQGTYNLNGGTVTLGLNGNIGGLDVGLGGPGTVNQSGGTLTVNGSFGAIQVGLSSNGTSIYNLSGTGVVVVDFLGLGADGYAQFNQSGGNVTAGNLSIGSGPVGFSYYSMGAGSPMTLTVNSSERIGNGGQGYFYQNVGTHISNGDMQIGVYSGSVGYYEIDATATLTEATNIGVGQNGNGTFSQTGGTATVAGGFYVGSGTGSVGVMNHTGGNLTVGTLYCGYNGNGTINLMAGNVTATSAMYIGQSNGMPAVLNLSSTGVLNLPNAPMTSNEGFIGTNGVLAQTGGSVNGYLFNSGTFNFSGGVFIGTLENGFTGTATISNSLTFGAGVKNHGAFNITGGSVGTAGGQTFSNDGTVTISGLGNINSNGPVVNNGLITGTGLIEVFANFTNNLTVTQGAGPLGLFVVGTAVNNGTITMATSRSFNLFSLLTNNGSFYVNGGLMSASGGTLANGVGGTVNGPGTILTGFISAGTVLPGTGTLNIASAWTNSGVVEMSGLASALTGGAITNMGTIQGFGTVGSAVTNSSGTLDAIGGTLVMGGTLVNSSGGTIAVSTGNKILVTGGLATNSGLINLVGGTFDNGGAAMDNTGEISGFGVLRTGGLTNDGNITFSGTNGSTTTINGVVTNDGNETINVKFNPAIFTGNFTNKATATVKITSTTVTFAAGFTNSGNYTSDPATNVFQAGATNSGVMSGGEGDVFNFAGGAVSNSGVFENGGTLQSGVNIVNTGTFTQTGGQSWGNGTTFTNNGGTATFGSDTGSAGSSPLSVVVNGGVVNFMSDQHLASLSVGSGKTELLSGTVKTNGLAIGSGDVDLTSGRLIVEATADHVGALALMESEAGNGGITSSALESNRVLVVSDNAVAGLTNFGGTGNVDSWSILVMAAYKGDYNLDGVVDIKDLQILATHWQQAVTDWGQGDENGSGFVDLVDLQALATDWQAGAGSGGGAGSFSEALAAVGGMGGGSEAVPEPMSVGVLAVGMALVGMRRRVRR